MNTLPFMQKNQEKSPTMAEINTVLKRKPTDTSPILYRTVFSLTSDLIRIGVDIRRLESIRTVSMDTMICVKQLAGTCTSTRCLDCLNICQLVNVNPRYWFGQPIVWPVMCMMPIANTSYAQPTPEEENYNDSFDDLYQMADEYDLYDPYQLDFIDQAVDIPDQHEEAEAPLAESDNYDADSSSDAVSDTLDKETNVTPVKIMKRIPNSVFKDVLEATIKKNGPTNPSKSLMFYPAYSRPIDLE